MNHNRMGVITRRTLISRAFMGAMAASLPLPLSAAQTAYPALFSPSGREIILQRWKGQGRHRGTVIFSHGAGSAPRHYERLCAPWAASGYDVIAPIHVDSSEHPRTSEFQGLASWTARLEDMRAIAASLGEKPFIAAGHSYGALTAIALGGGVSLVPQGVEGPLHHPRTLGVAAFSPPPAISALVGAGGYAPLAVPSFHQSGTRDLLSPTQKPEEWMDHLHAFDAAPSNGRHHALVLPEVDHYFGGLICKPDAAGPQMPEKLAEAVRLSTLFFDMLTRPSAKRQQLWAQELQAEGLIGLRRK